MDTFSDIQSVVTRSEAAMNGLPTYFTGKPCKRGHIAERRAGYGTCMECESERGRSSEMRAYKSEYRYKNSEKCKASHAKWRSENADKVRNDKTEYYADNRKDCIAKSTAWASENRDKSRKFISSWKSGNADKIASYSRNRRARIADADGTHTSHDVSKIRDMQKDKCAMCKAKLRRRGHVDHIIAIANGGSNWPRNLQILCEPCNLSKNAKDPIMFAQERGLLI